MVTFLVGVHDRALCAGQPCCVHNPTEGHMLGWPQHWRADRRFMERLCRHRIGHPDPDHMHYLRRTFGDERAWEEGIHGCDGCCAPSTTGDVDR